MDTALLELLRTVALGVAAIIIAGILRQPLLKLFSLPEGWAVSNKSSPQLPQDNVAAPRAKVDAAGLTSEDASREIYFWRTYAFIYDSQLQAMRFLRQRGTVAEQELQPFYALALSRGLLNATFETWLLYLLASQLVTREQGEDGTPRLRLTETGRQFTEWADRQFLFSGTRL